MSAPSYIRRHINNLVGSKPFSIRDFLIYGPRNTIDQVFHRLVQSGRIIRVARGVYIKSDSPVPMVVEVVAVKAAAFGRKIITHGSQAMEKLFVGGRSESRQKVGCLTGGELLFACNGSNSLFRVGRCVVRFVRTSNRKMQLADSPVGLSIRALGHLGKRACSKEAASKVINSFGREERRMLRLAAASMPQWMRECFACLLRMDCLRNDIEPARTS